MPIAGGFIAVSARRKVVKVTAIILSPLLLLLTLLAGSVDGQHSAVFLLGGFVGAMDVAMNANAVEVEKCDAPWQSCPRAMPIGASAG